jgi:hypothetical protein
VHELGVDLGMKQLYHIRIKRDIRSITIKYPIHI